MVLGVGGRHVGKNSCNRNWQTRRLFQVALSLQVTCFKVANTKSASERREVRDDIKENIDKLTNSIAEAFHKNDIPVAHKLVIKYKYYDNAYQKLREMLV